MANCVFVMIKMLPLFNFTISCNGRRAWKTTRCACALAGSRYDWLNPLSLGTIEKGPNASLEEVVAFVESKESGKRSLQQLNGGPMQLLRSVRFENNRGERPSSKLHPHPCLLRRALTAARSAMVAAETSAPKTA